jgi:hypothetical protein
VSKIILIPELPGSRLEDINKTQRAIYHIPRTHIARSTGNLEMMRTIMFAGEVLKEVTYFVNAEDCERELNKLVEEGRMKMVGVIEKSVAKRLSEHKRVKLRLKEWNENARERCGRRAKVGNENEEG